MKIAFISSVLSFPWGGADSLWTRTAEAAAQRGDQLLLALSAQTSAHTRIARLCQQGALLHSRTRHAESQSGRERLRDWLRRAAGRPSLLSALARFWPDVVVLCQGGTYDFLVEPLLVQHLHRLRVPFVVISQSNSEQHLNEDARAAARKFFAAAHAVVFVSQHNLRLAERQLAHEITNAHVVQNPLPQAVSEQPWPTSDRCRFAAVARLDSHDKGLDVMLVAVARTLAAEQNWELAIFGRGPDRPYLESLVRKLKLEDHVRFAGFVDDVTAIWSDHHVLLLPSRFEGCSLAMMEGLASGRPVIATAVGGVDEWIEEGVNGFISPAAQEDALSLAIQRAWSARREWPALGRRAAERARQLLDPAPERKILELLPRP